MSNADEALLAGVPVIPRGEKVAGQFFPLLYEPDAVENGQADPALRSDDTSG